LYQEKHKTMDTKTLSLMKHIERIVAETQDKKLSQESIDACGEHMNALAQKLDITPMQALLLSVFIDQCDDECIRLGNLAKHFQCQNVNVMCYLEDIDTLASKGYIRKRKEKRQTYYRVPEKVIGALKKNTVYVLPSLQGLTVQVFFKELARLYSEITDRELCFDELQKSLTELVEDNKHLQFCKTVLNYPICADDLPLLIFF
jgi:hypothetical protein